MTEPTRDEVNAILAQYEDSLEISPGQLLELAHYAGLEPNFSGMSVGVQALQDLRDQAREALTIREELPPAPDRYTAAQQARNDYEWQQTHKDWPRGLTLARVLREYWRPAVKFIVALVADATRTHWHKAFWFLVAVAGVVALVMWWGAL